MLSLISKFDVKLSFKIAVIIAFCAFVWLILGHKYRLAARLIGEGIILPKTEFRILNSTGYLRKADHVIASDWASISTENNPETHLREIQFDRPEKKSRLELLRLKFSACITDDSQWNTAKFYYGEGIQLKSEFWVVRLSNDEVFVWISVQQAKDDRYMTGIQGSSCIADLFADPQPLIQPYKSRH